MFCEGGGFSGGSVCVHAAHVACKQATSLAFIPSRLLNFYFSFSICFSLSFLKFVVLRTNVQKRSSSFTQLASYENEEKKEWVSSSLRNCSLSYLEHGPFPPTESPVVPLGLQQMRETTLALSLRERVRACVNIEKFEPHHSHPHNQFIFLFFSGRCGIHLKVFIQ